MAGASSSSSSSSSSLFPLAIISALDADAAHSIYAFLPFSDFLRSAQVCRRWYNHACTQPNLCPHLPPVSLPQLRLICLSPLWRGVRTLEVGFSSGRVSLFDLPALHHVMRSLRSLALFLDIAIGREEDRESKIEQADDRCQTGAETALVTPTTQTARPVEAHAAPANAQWAQVLPASLTELYLDVNWQSINLCPLLSLPALTQLVLCCDLSRDSCKLIKSLSRLRHLDWGYGWNSESSLMELLTPPHALTQLETLHVCISHNEFVDPALRELLAGLPQLTDFGMPPHAYGIHGSLSLPVTELELLRFTPRLRRMHVYDDDSRYVSAGRLELLVRELDSMQLQTLRFGNGPGSSVNGWLVSLMLPRLPQLTVLSLTADDPSLEFVVHLPLLEQLFHCSSGWLQRDLWSSGMQPVFGLLVQLRHLRRLHVHVYADSSPYFVDHYDDIAIPPVLLTLPTPLEVQLQCFHLSITRSGREDYPFWFTHRADSECCLTNNGEEARPIRVGRPRECRLEDRGL